MTTPQRHLNISAGTSFSQSFSVTNEDLSPTDLTNYTVSARLAKRAGAYDALTSTSTTPVFKFSNFTVTVTDAATGAVTISLTDTETAALEEGKYVYSLLLDDGAGTVTEFTHGLVTVRSVPGFGTTL